ncbi:hypothetical protein K438DRAFT_1996661 [Mycena galopus ATCC 62051]|nr:hypothetical protein K438DRAFT_1996661 [Mycena galopus ATCC 62051]
MDWIWSDYTISPDPASGMQSLYQTCSMLTKHVLLPSHLILSGGGFTLLPELTNILTDVAGLWTPRYSKLLPNGTTGLTCSTGLDIATQNQVVWNWIHLADKLHIAMVDLESLCHAHPVHILGHESSSWMRQIIAALPWSLLIKLPAELLCSHCILLLPLAANAWEVEHQQIQHLDHCTRMLINTLDAAQQHHHEVQLAAGYTPVAAILAAVEDPPEVHEEWGVLCATESFAVTEPADTSHHSHPPLMRGWPTTTSIASTLPSSRSLPSSAFTMSKLPGAGALPSACSAAMATAQLPVSNAGLQNLVRTPSRSSMIAVELGGHVEQHSEKSVAFQKDNLLLLPPAPVITAGVCTVELGGLKDVVTDEQSLISNGESRTFDEFEPAMPALLPSATSSLPLSAPSPAVMLSQPLGISV